ncbi:RcnB family protein [Sphingomonas sp.]|uniref:RcnB family protein n=1 Tax=Sphingomonas sp. TaxID=28214 RepID=UPI002DD693AD|nr:RcnB family protein [Sphingomonas sp.]
MRKFIITGLIAAVAMPAMAVPAAAQSQREVRRDAREVRDARRDLDRAHARGDRRDVREARRDLRDARADQRHSVNERDRRWGNDDWRGWRDRNRGTYSRGSWNAPFRYQSFRAGVRIGAPYYAQRHWIADPWRYRLAPAARYQQWVRHYDDALLVDTRRGTVVRVIRNFYW